MVGCRSDDHSINFQRLGCAGLLKAHRSGSIPDYPTKTEDPFRGSLVVERLALDQKVEGPNPSPGAGGKCGLLHVRLCPAPRATRDR